MNISSPMQVALDEKRPITERIEARDVLRERLVAGTIATPEMRAEVRELVGRPIH